MTNIAATTFMGLASQGIFVILTFLVRNKQDALLLFHRCNGHKRLLPL